MNFTNILIGLVVIILIIVVIHSFWSKRQNKEAAKFDDNVSDPDVINLMKEKMSFDLIDDDDEHSQDEPQLSADDFNDNPIATPPQDIIVPNADINLSTPTESLTVGDNVVEAPQNEHLSNPVSEEKNHIKISLRDKKVYDLTIDELKESIQSNEHLEIKSPAFRNQLMDVVNKSEENTADTVANIDKLVSEPATPTNTATNTTTSTLANEKEQPSPFKDDICQVNEQGFFVPTYNMEPFTSRAKSTPKEEIPAPEFIMPKTKAESQAPESKPMVAEFDMPMPKTMEHKEANEAKSYSDNSALMSSLLVTPMESTNEKAVEEKTSPAPIDIPTPQSSQTAQSSQPATPAFDGLIQPEITPQVGTERIAQPEHIEQSSQPQPSSDLLSSSMLSSSSNAVEKPKQQTISQPQSNEFLTNDLLDSSYSNSTSVETTSTSNNLNNKSSDEHISEASLIKDAEFAVATPSELITPPAETKSAEVSKPSEFIQPMEIAQPEEVAKPAESSKPLIEPIVEPMVEQIVEPVITTTDNAHNVTTNMLEISENTSMVAHTELAGQAPEPAHEEPNTVNEQPKNEQIIMLYLVAQDQKDILGADLAHALDKEGFILGEKQIFHRHSEFNNPQSPILFSLANLENNGVFHEQDMQDMRTFGVAMFMQLPSEYGSNAPNLRLMLSCARALAKDLNAILLDDNQEQFSTASERYYLSKLL